MYDYYIHILRFVWHTCTCKSLAGFKFCQDDNTIIGWVGKYIQHALMLQNNESCTKIYIDCINFDSIIMS